MTENTEKSVARAMADEDARLALLEEYAAGDLGRDAARERGLSEEELELFAPLGEDFVQSTVVATSPRPVRRLFARRAVVASAATLLAASIVWVILPSSADPIDLSRYRSEFQGGNAEFRGEEPAVPVARTGPFTWVLQPLEKIDAPLSARLYTVDEAGTAKPFVASVDVSRTGAVRVTGQLAELPETARALGLWVGPRDQTPPETITAEHTRRLDERSAFLVQPLNLSP
ncbi:MAG: hypothetical protein AAFU77_04385 [Myxococcota bacterium]